MPARRFNPVCPHCRYDLRASMEESGARCPECGRWTSREALSAVHRKRSAVVRVARALRWVAPSLVAAPILLPAFERHIDPDPYIGAAMAFGFLASVVSGLSIGAEMSRSSPWWERLYAVFATITCIAVLNLLMLAGGIYSVVSILSL